ncbi:hypothetical protein L9F63_027631 [Diploptera punctata]|uniref:BTB domain-containing protein n=1 Tax=Diploptera punctata TaxID=6984 RepID=A0AAD8EKQ7_DIPPU|nr:hypothetical protein L9F63_027631 [Diploptera punctata]
MCPNDNPAYAKPLLPRRWDSLFDSEAGSDVEFLVGPEQWRFPGHKTVLAAANPVFEAMLTGPMATHDTTIPIEDVDGRAFENLLRYLYKEDIHMQSIKTALKTLYAAFKYQCGGLNSSSQNSTPTPSAPPLESEDSAGNHSYLSGINENIPDAIIYCGALHHNCLQYIDQNASKVLVQEQVEDLDIEVLRLIAERENLDLISERILFDALDRWCNRECKKRRLELTAENRRAVLGQDILFCVRYLLMTPNEFLEGPMQSGLLNQVERSVISAHIRRTPSIPSMHLEGVLVKMRTPRGKMCGEANHLSKRTAPVITHCDVSSSPSGSSARRTGRWGKKKEGKKVVKQKSKSCSPDRDSHKRSTGACFTEYFFSALSCVFD